MKKHVYLPVVIISILMIFSSCKKDDDEPKGLDTAKAYCAEPAPDIMMCTELPQELTKSDADKNLRAVVLNDYRWRTGETIKIKFLNGRKKIQEKVKKYAVMWLNYANLRFEFVGIDDHADIKIAFKWDCDYTTWSRVGTDNRKCEQYSPSMNFGWLDDSSTEKEMKRVILHEFGHALGLIHEHQHPEANIQWNKDVVYDYYESKGWSKKDVDTNMFDKYNSSQTNYSQFDNESIMLYAISEDFTLNGFSIPWNYELSDTDKQFIGSLYPY